MFSHTRRLGLISLACAAIIGLSACAPDGSSGEPGASGGTTTPPGSTTGVEVPTASTPPPELIIDGSAEQNLPFFDDVLSRFAASDAAVEGRPIVDSLTAEGFARDDMQVSFDRSKTNLVADSIYVSVLVNDACLLGQIVVADRSVHTIVEPAVGPENNICLIGETRPIDW